MGFSGFLEYIERICPQACERVDLGQLARKRLQQSAGPGRRGRALVGQNPLFLLVDAESCLHRLYGGSFTDWVCGGEWNNMFHFVDNLARACRSNNIKLIVFFSGSLEKGRIQEWIKTQNQARNTAYQVLSHVHNKGTPPPKAWFTPPVAIDTCVRLAMRQCGITTFSSNRDHPREVITYLRQYGCHGILAQTPEFALFDPPLLFSSHLMKLTKKGELLSVQYSMEEVAKTLNLHPERFVILAALLGNHILTEEDLALFHWSLLGPDHPLNGLRLRAQQLILPPLDVIINTVSEYVRNLPDTRNLEAVARDVFKSSTSRTEEKIRRFKACVEYYWYGTREAWTRSRGKVPKFSHYSSSGQHNNVSHKNQANTQTTQESAAPQIVVQAPEQPQSDLEKELTDDIHAQMEEDLEQRMTDMTLETIEDSLSEGEGTEGKAGSQQRPQTSTRSKTSQDPQLPSSSSSLSSKPPTTSSTTEAQSSDTSSTTATSRSSIPSLMEQPILPCLLVEAPPLPFVAPEVLRIAKHRHETGTMMAQVAQALRWGEIKIGVTLEDEMSGEFPLSTHLFRPIRQKVYGILFSCQHLKEVNGSGEMPKVVLKEWLIRRESTLPKPDLVEATPMEWLVPPIQRLWLGREPEDKTMRLRAFLSCMYSDSPAMLKTTYVPRHAIILCCVLRYMLHFSPPILRRHELDALLAQSVSPCLNQPQTLQELRVPSITARGVQLAAIFMRGVEAALFANDACGAPIPWELCCPWLYFDGKLFQYKLHRAMTGSNLRDLCDGKMDQVGKVERMRQCIQEGVHIDFARPVIPHMGHPHQFPPQEYYYNFRPAGAGVPQIPPQMGRGRGMPGKRPPVPGPGGRLEVAGVVVGEWAGSDGSRGRGGMYSGSGTAVRGGRPNQRGGMGRGTYGNGAMHGYFPAGPQQMWGVPDARQQQLYGDPGPGYRRQNQSKPKPKKTQRNNGDGSGVGKGRGRGMTIETEEPSAGGAADTERVEEEEEGYAVEEQAKLSASDSVSDTSSSEEDVPGAFSDAKETLSPMTDFNPAPTDFQGASEDVVSSYHEGGYDLPGTHHAGPPYNGGVDTVHAEGGDVGDP
ncbi:constitutive coactivator of PPAR-gamma-like protein 1 homolog [Patiria miniata]|uniref:Constitutive coactivator of PPAR-gamma-like protein 1 homolog n=1 Tax=Patiria miniata TaxID=46514 RepID=A0A914AC69_PATMI|nr:constitutive coactivator of PPAR-gamma-like protein 1 homolog [Patiria miniata]